MVGDAILPKDRLAVAENMQSERRPAGLVSLCKQTCDKPQLDRVW